jgi:RNA polymerase sigma-70 factor, ECF subfamily
MMKVLAQAEFGQLITQAQRSLFALIRTLVLDEAAAEDVLQETNLALWSQADRFEPGSNFAAWAARVAYFKVLDYRKRCSRDRLRFSEELLEQLAQEAITDLNGFDTRNTALMQCLQMIPPERRRVLDLYYGKRWSQAQIGEDLGKSAGAVRQLMARIRMMLRNCVRRRLGIEENSYGN